MNNEIETLLIDIGNLAEDIEAGFDSGSITVIENLDELTEKYDIEVSRELSPLEIRDWILCGTLGTAAGVIDFIKNKVDKELTNTDLTKLYDDFQKKITGGKAIAVDHIATEGVSAESHRIFGAGHDLLRFPEILRQVMKGEFRALIGGKKVISNTYREVINGMKCKDYFKTDNPHEALVAIVFHLLSDFFSEKSLPIPGTSYITENNNKDIVRWMVRLYREGTNLRSFVAEIMHNLSSAVLIRFITYLYRQIDRCVNNEEFIFSLTNDIRYQELCRNAFSISFSISGFKSFYYVNPFTINMQHYAQAMYSTYQMNKSLNSKHEEFKNQLNQFEEWL